MTIWSGIGVNYGHQAIYDTSVVESDFSYFNSVGITRVRIAMGGYGNSAHIANGQDMVARALNHGLYAIWGVSTGYGRPNLTATIWAAYKNYVLNTLAPWVQSNELPELCIGNECDYQVDGTTLTAATVRSDIRSMASTIRANGYIGNLSYSSVCQDAFIAAWNTEGLGDLDLIGFNSYDTLTNFSRRNSSIISDFDSKAYISEFGSKGGGYPDFNNETAFYNDTASRIQSMQNSGIASGYFFCYRDGGYGVPANSFGLIETDGTVHLARNAVLGQ